jgi:hypothetical protein
MADGAILLEDWLDIFRVINCICSRRLRDQLGGCGDQTKGERAVSIERPPLK